MGKKLLNTFASEDPERFARLLEASEDTEEMLSILEDIDTGLECEVVARLSPELANRLVNGLDDGLLIAWLETGSVEAGQRLLSMVGPNRSNRLVEGIGDRRRRRLLRQLTGYAAGTIGQHTRFRLQRFREDVPLEQVKAELQRHKEPFEGPVVIERRDRTVMGVLDFAAMARNSSEKALAADVCIRVQPLYADSPLPHLSSLSKFADWEKATSLPVVDHRKRLVGYVTRATLEKATDSEHEGSLFLSTLIELVKQYWTFMAYVMTSLLGRRVQS